MKRIVIYSSKTGFTKKYAEWIAGELNCEAVALKEMPGQLDAYDCIIYGGGIMAGKIGGLDKIKKNPAIAQKQLIVFATGATPSDAEEIIQEFKNGNLTAEEQEKVPFFYFESGLNFEDMGFFSRTLLSMMQKSLMKKKDRTPEEEGMLTTFSASSDHTDKAYIVPLVEYVRK